MQIWKLRDAKIALADTQAALQQEHRLRVEAEEALALAGEALTLLDAWLDFDAISDKDSRVLRTSLERGQEALSHPALQRAVDRAKDNDECDCHATTGP